MQERPWFATYRAFGIPAEIGAPKFRSVTAMLESAMQRFAARPA